MDNEEEKSHDTKNTQLKKCLRTEKEQSATGS